MDIVKVLKDKFDKKILLRNDAQCAALAEKEIGSIKNYDDVIFLTIGTGIGGSVFLGGKMLTPKRQRGFEIGHMVMDLNGKRCTCGRKGCFETMASMKQFKNDIKERLKIDSETTGVQIRQLLEYKDQYDTVEDIIDNYIYNLSEGLANLITIFAPEAIAIGGSFAHYDKFLLNKLRNELTNKDALFTKDLVPKIILASLKNEAGIIGSTLDKEE